MRSTGSNELQPSAVENFHFSTTDYCTVELAPAAAKLIVLLSFPIKGRKTFVITHAANIATHRVYNQGIQNYYLEVVRLCTDLDEATVLK